MTDSSAFPTRQPASTSLVRTSGDSALAETPRAQVSSGAPVSTGGSVRGTT
jgi:hypothetical protein